MTKNFRDILKEVEGPRTADAKKFVNDFHRRHLTLDADDPSNDWIFGASNIPKDHSKKNGYKPGEDVKAYAAAQGRSKIINAADNDESKLPSKIKGPNIPNEIVNPDPNIDPVPTKKTTDFAAEGTEHEDAARQNLHDVKKDLDGVETIDLRTSKARDLLNILATAHKHASGVTEVTAATGVSYWDKAMREKDRLNGEAAAKKKARKADENDAKAASMGIDRHKAPLRKEDLDVVEGRFQLNWKSNAKFQGKPLSSHTFSVKAKSQDDAIKRAAKYIEKVDGSDNAHAVTPHNVFRVSENHAWPEGTVTIDELSTYTMKSYLNKSLRQELGGGKVRKMRGLAARKVDQKERRGVSEEADLGEMSTDTLANYAIAAADARKGSNKYEKRTKGIKLADRKLSGKAKVSAKVMEDVIDLDVIDALPLDEVSKDLVRRYHNKASEWQDAANSDRPPENAHNVVSSNGKKTYKWAQRANSMDLADRKLSGAYYKGARPVKQRATEEVEPVNELSTKTLASYVSKAHTDSVQKHKQSYYHGTQPGARDGDRYHGDLSRRLFNKAVKRDRGIGKAMGRVMTREEALDESYAEVKDMQYQRAFDALDQIASLLELCVHDEEAYYSAAANSPNGVVTAATPGVSSSRLWSTDLGYLTKQLEDVRDALLAAKPEDEDVGGED